MRIPIGVEYTSNVEGEVSLPFSCGTCNHEAIAFVRAKGTGDATAYAFIGMGSAKERASTAASQDLVNRANQMIQAAKCPGCGARDGSALARMQARARNSIVGYFIGGIVIAFVLPTSVGWINGVMPFVGLLLGYFNYSSAAWQWTEVDQRVRFSSADEEAEVIAEAVTGLVGDWRPGFRRRSA